MSPWNLKMSNNNVLRYTRKELLNKNRKKPCVCCCVLQTQLILFLFIVLLWSEWRQHWSVSGDTLHMVTLPGHRTLHIGTWSAPGDRCGAIRIHWDTPRLLGTRSTTVTPSLYTGHSVAIMSNSRTRQLWWWWQEVPDDIENKDITKEDD